jgi:hypothetical protein
MNNEPVAWFEQDPDMKSIWYQCDKDAPNAIPLYTHPAKELHLSLQKTEDGELVAITYTDDEHRIVEVLWEKPPAKTLTDEEIMLVSNEFKGLPVTSVEAWNKVILLFAKAILRKAQEK